MDYDDVEYPMQQQLYNRMGQIIERVNTINSLLSAYVYDGRPTTTTSKYELIEQIKFLCDDLKFTSIHLNRVLEDKKIN